MPSGSSVFVATWVGYAGFYLCRKNFSVLMPLFGEHLGAERGLLANALFIYSAAYALGQVSMGVLADRIGARSVVLGGMLVSSAATLAMGFTSNPGILHLWLGINGLAQACGWPALVKIVSSWFGRTCRGVTVGLWCTSYVIGAFAATAFATFSATGGSWSWRAGAWAPAALLAMLAFPVWWFARE